jgi:hypothetical protein
MYNFEVGASVVLCHFPEVCQNVTAGQEVMGIAGLQTSRYLKSTSSKVPSADLVRG